MNTFLTSSTIRRSVVLVGAGLCGVAGLLAAAPKEAPLENYIDISAGYTSDTGSKPALQKALQNRAGGYGGIEGLYYTKAINDETTLVIKGKALAGANDYLFDLSIIKENGGYVKFGYREFRVWFDGLGGYLPSTGFIRKLHDEDLAIDRGNLWFEAGYRAEDKPAISLRYDLFTRKGTKDSTSWADTGLAVNTSNLRGLLPTFLKIDEKRHQVVADVSKKGEKIGWALGARVDKGEYTNGRYERRRAGESTTDRKVTHKEGQDYDLFQVRGSYENQIHENLLITTAVARTTIDTTLSGSRIYGQDFDPVYDAAYLNRQQRDEGFFGLHGESEMKQIIGTISARYQPKETVVIVPSFRFEQIDWSNKVDFEETNFGGAPAFAPINDEVEADSEKDWKVYAESVDVRYTGIKNVSLSFKGEWTKSEGDLTEERILEPGTALQVISIDRDTKFERNTQKYAATANWYAKPGSTVAVQYYYKVRTNDFRSVRDNTVSTSDRYPAYVANQDFETNDFNVRFSTKLGANLRSVTRYDYQKSTITTQDVGLLMAESANMTSHIFAETLTWNPSNRWYVQGGVNLVWDTLTTPAVKVTGGAVNLVKNSDANYTSLNLGSGYAVDDQSDLFVDYSLTQSKDSFVDNSNRTVAFGSDIKVQQATVTWNRRIDYRTSISLKYGYAKSDNAVSGGYADFEAHMIYGKVQYRF
ncbi:MAG: hypothetical protein HYV95_08490 [Opitutae bacterium]|nr:hypothetical protein [Opitutae bacterium]